MSVAGHQIARLERRLSRLEAEAAAIPGGPSAQAQRDLMLLRGEIATLRLRPRG